MKAPMISDLDSYEFEERADYLPEDLLISWSPKNEHFNHVQKKLLQVGAKLIVGPRGAGKTHYIRYAYFTSKNDKKMPLPIYVTFNHYLRLETYLHEKSNAIDIFHTWVLSKIIDSCCSDYNIELSKYDIEVNDLKEFINDIERQQYKPKFDSIISKLNIELTQTIIDDCINKEGRKRAVLFFDDAALTLTKEYMVEFFDIFRSIKTSRIAPKASVYPGTTQYGPRFHVGQDAEAVSIWEDVENSHYLDFMHSLVKDRFATSNKIDADINNLLIYSSFGIPRAYINLIRSYLESKSRTKQSRFNSVIKERCDYLNNEYMSIVDKLPQYVNYINIGWDFFIKLIDELKTANHDQIRSNSISYSKIVTIGFEGIESDKIERMISFLIEAGLLYEISSISHGVNRNLKRYIPHYAYLIKDKTFTISRGFNSSELLKIIDSQSSKHPLRRKINTILSNDAIKKITLSLPNCSNCDAERLSDNQKFCHSCGSRLVDRSAYKECMKIKLVDLPLTKFQKYVVSQTKFKTVEDVISSINTADEFMKVKKVANKRAGHLDEKIKMWVTEFLEK
ncbi:MAG: zinc ribbon domain-containing protein [Pseudomonadota bacterium]